LGSAGLLTGGLTIVTACLPQERQAGKKIPSMSSARFSSDAESLDVAMLGVMIASKCLANESLFGL
jgi:hypothetical protein